MFGKYTKDPASFYKVFMEIEYIEMNNISEFDDKIPKWLFETAYYLKRVSLKNDCKNESYWNYRQFY